MKICFSIERKIKKKDTKNIKIKIKLSSQTIPISLDFFM